MVLFINVKDINDEAETNTSYLISKSLIIKEIEDDLETATKINVKNCSITDFYKKSYISSIPSLCIAFEFDDNEDDVGYLGIYSIDTTNVTKPSYQISYIHVYEDKNIRQTRVFEEFNSNNINKYTAKIATINTNKNMVLLNIPIIGPDNKDYSLNISYYGNITCNICS